jgi:hypothetical protein
VFSIMFIVKYTARCFASIVHAEKNGNLKSNLSSISDKLIFFFLQKHKNILFNKWHWNNWILVYKKNFPYKPHVICKYELKMDHTPKYKA